MKLHPFEKGDAAIFRLHKESFTFICCKKVCLKGILINKNKVLDVEC